MINKVAVALTVVMALVFALLAWIAFHYYGKAVATADSLAVAIQQKNEAEYISKTQALAVSTFNAIAGATLDEQKTNAATSQDRQVVIKTVLKAEPCALAPVPAAAADSLREHYNAIRASTSNANTSQSSTSVPAVTASK